MAAGGPRGAAGGEAGAARLLERGRNAPRMEDLVLLSEVLGMPFEELGLGPRLEEAFSAAELTELARHLAAMARLLKPWMSRLRG